MIELTPRADGFILPILAQPGARRNGVVGVHGGRLKIAVTQVAEKGRANDALLEVLARELDLRRSQVAFVAGGTSRQKTVLVSGVTREALLLRLARWATPDP